MSIYKKFLAPMEGVTNFVVRDFFAEHSSVDLVSTEFVRVCLDGLSSKVVRREIVKHKSKPLSVQLMGNDPYEMGKAAKMIDELGVDVIDINLGCPSSRASRSGVGAKLLTDPELVYEIVSRMRENISCLQSAKIRAGFNNSDNIFRIVELLEKAGVDLIIVHPRRRVDFYEGKADWGMIRDIKKCVTIPVIGNGDIWSAQDAIDMLAETNADGLMIGRGAMRNPWIFNQIDCLKKGEDCVPVTGRDLIGYLNALINGYQQQLGLSQGSILGRMKELIHWIVVGLDDGIEIKKKLLRLQSLDEFYDEFEKFFCDKKVI